MVVRKARATDARAIAEIHVRSWQAAYRGLIPDEVLANLSIDQRERQWQMWLGDPKQDVFVYEDDKPLAFLSLGPQRDDDKDPRLSRELYTLYALPEAWDHGCGRALWKTSLEHLKDQPYTEVTLWVLKGNNRAIHFYEQAGFHPDGKSKTETWSNGLTLNELRYTRRLNPD